MVLLHYRCSVTAFIIGKNDGVDFYARLLEGNVREALASYAFLVKKFVFEGLQEMLFIYTWEFMKGDLQVPILPGDLGMREIQTLCPMVSQWLWPHLHIRMLIVVRPEWHND